LNLYLYDELLRMNPDAEAFLFDDVVDGIKDFAIKTGVKADKLPSTEETKEIKNEEKALLTVVEQEEGQAYLNMITAAARKGHQQWHGRVIQPMIVQHEVPPELLEVRQPIFFRPPPPPPPPSANQERPADE
jgi:hypothetical protein